MHGELTCTVGRHGANDNVGAAEVYAWIADENRTAMRFYERLGFGPTGDRRSMPAHAEEWETLLVHHVQIEERRAPGAA